MACVILHSLAMTPESAIPGHSDDYNRNVQEDCLMRLWTGVLSLALASVLMIVGMLPARAQMMDEPEPLPVTVSLATDRIYYRPGEPVVMRITVRNVGTETVTLRFPSSQRYDFVVRHITGEVVWQWSANRYFLWVLGAETLEPGETRVITEEWKQQNNLGNQVRTGIYRLESVLPTWEPEPMLSNWSFIQVGRRLF
jgi:hypothetical protein